MKINLKINSIKNNKSIVKIKNSRISEMNSQKNTIITIKLIILKKTVEKKILSKNHKNSSINQIQILTAIKIDNSET